MKTELNRTLNDAVVRRLAGDRSYRRGYDYHQHGHAESIEAGAHTVRALARGSQDYTVTLTSDDGVLTTPATVRKALMARSANTALPPRSPA